jgi:integrase
LITRRHVADVVDSVAARGSFVVADRVLGFIRAIYNWANGTGWLEVNPTLKLKKRNVGKPHERVLSDTEIQTLWRALETAPKLSPEIYDALRLELLLGVRIGEALGAAKSEIDLEGRTWTIPALRTKAKREHPLPLPQLAESILRSALRRAGASTRFFSSPIDGKAMRPKSASRAVLRVRGRTDLLDVGTHDLRRTLATGLGNLGIPDQIIERVLNHAPTGIPEIGSRLGRACHCSSV